MSATPVVIGDRFASNYGPLIVYREARLADANRMVGLVVEGGGAKFGIPEHDPGSRFPRLERAFA